MSQLPNEYGLRDIGMRTVKQLGVRYNCPVCGYGLEYPPADFNICPSCGVEFGYETAGRSFYELRQEWVQTGARWTSRVDPKPKNWNPWLQLAVAHLFYKPPFGIAEIHAVPSKSAETAITVFRPTWNNEPVGAFFVTR